LARESIPPEEVTKVRIYIANCLWNLATPPDTEGLFNKAIDYAKQAAAEYESRNENQEWAWTLNYLASGFRDLPTGDRRRNLQAAIEYNTKALAVYDVSTSPLKWADTQEVLGDTYGQMPTENRAENLREARDHYNKALEIYCDPFFPYPEQYRVWDKVKKVENELTKLERR